MYKEIKNCRICGNSELVSIMNIGNQSLTGTFPHSKNDDIPSGPVELVMCSGKNTCGLVQLKQSYDISMMYGENYGYRSGLNQSMVDHLKSKISTIMDKNILHDGDLIIDIGSNDGTSLGFYPSGKYNLLGVDPTGKKFIEHYPEGVSLIPEFFTGEVVHNFTGGKKAKVITSFSMYYDLEDPVAFAREVEETLDENGIWVCEQSYLPAMLKANSFDTICHEHLEFYSLKQIEWIAKEAGLKIVDIEFNDVNGGSFSTTACKISSSIEANEVKLNEVRIEESKLCLDKINVYDSFKERVEEIKKRFTEFLNKQKNAGKLVVGLGASTKGNVLLQYFKIDDELIKYIGEVNDDKFGKYTPGSLIPLISEEELLKLNPDYIVVLPWHFREFFNNLPSMKGRRMVYPLPNFEIIQL